MGEPHFTLHVTRRLGRLSAHSDRQAIVMPRKAKIKGMPG